MKIALDYDDTYTLDPEMWETIIKIFESRGHEVKIVTARDQNIDIVHEEVGAEIVYCNGVAKEYYMRRIKGWEPNVWIDDNPKNIINNSTMSDEELLEWRKSKGILN